MPVVGQGKRQDLSRLPLIYSGTSISESGTRYIDVIKVGVAILGIAVVAYLTLSFWASCDLRYDVCTAVCDVRHTDSDIEKMACKTGCTSERIGCVSKEYLDKRESKQ
jgi:hypothetical protein